MFYDILCCILHQYYYWIYYDIRLVPIYTICISLCINVWYRMLVELRMFFVVVFCEVMLCFGLSELTKLLQIRITQYILRRLRRAVAISVLMWP